MKCPTVKVCLGDSYMVINESDFDEEIHEVYVSLADKKAVDPKKKAPKKKAE